MKHILLLLLLTGCIPSKTLFDSSEHYKTLWEIQKITDEGKLKQSCLLGAVKLMKHVDGDVSQENRQAVINFCHDLTLDNILYVSP